jgi:hypothetical protein
MTIQLLDASHAARLRERLNADGAFHQVSREMALSLALEIGDETRLLTFRDGALRAVGPFVPMAEPVDVLISGTEDFWHKLLSPVPPPRFQNLYAAIRAETCVIRGNGELYAAYFAAITRLIEVMRDLQNSQH